MELNWTELLFSIEKSVAIRDWMSPSNVKHSIKFVFEVSRPETTDTEYMNFPSYVVPALITTVVASERYSVNCNDCTEKKGGLLHL